MKAKKQKTASNKGSQKFERFPERKELKLTDKELKRTIGLMIARVEKRVTLEPFNAICWRSSDKDIAADFILVTHR